MKTKYIVLLISYLTIASLYSCKDDENISPEEQLEKDISIIEEHLLDNNIEANRTASGIFYTITDTGIVGAKPNLSSKVEVLYKGYFLSGQVFDKTKDNKTATFGLNGVIKGWQEAIPLLNKNGKGTFYMPSSLCYGPTGSGPIPPNEVLVFDIKLVDFQ